MTGSGRLTGMEVLMAGGVIMVLVAPFLLAGWIGERRTKRALEARKAEEDRLRLVQDHARWRNGG